MLKEKIIFALCKGFIFLIDNACEKNAEPFTTFPIKSYQSEEDPRKGQILDKDFECFLCLVVSILNSAKINKVIILHILEKIKTEGVPQK